MHPLKASLTALAKELCRTKSAMGTNAMLSPSSGAWTRARTMPTAHRKAEYPNCASGKSCRLRANTVCCNAVYFPSKNCLQYTAPKVDVTPHGGLGLPILKAFQLK